MMNAIQLPIASDQDLVYSERSNFIRLMCIGQQIKDFEPMLHYQCGTGVFVRYCRQNGYEVHGFDMNAFVYKKKPRPESVMTLLVVNQFQSLEQLEWHLPFITEMLMFGGCLIIENPFYEVEDAMKIGLPWTDTLAFMQSKGFVYQFNLALNTPMFANNNNGTKIRRR